MPLRIRAERELRARKRKIERRHADIDWLPLEGPQTDAYRSEADELLYGGAAGGGKTFLEIGLAVTQHQQAILFRREFPQLAEIEDQLDALLGGLAQTNRNKHRWTLPDGRFIETGAVQRLDDWKKYKGRPHDYVAFDELTEFTRMQYRMLIVWNRTADPDQRCRVVSGTNPPLSEEQMWVIEEWAPWLDKSFSDPARPGELRYYVYDDHDTIKWFRPEALDGGYVVVEGRRRQAKSRTFIPARLEDNPYLVASGYGRSLDVLPPALRAAFREGDFAAGIETDPWQAIPTEWVRAAQARWSPEMPTLPDAEGQEQPLPLSALGVDPARGGKDETVIAPRYGWWFGPLSVYPGKDTPDGPSVAAQVMQHHEEAATIVLDVIGVGAAVYDALAAHDFSPWGFNASERSAATDKTGQLTFVNRRAEAWWRMRELLDPASGMDVALPPDPRLRSDLCAPRFKLTVRGIQIEAKADVKKRLGRSTDRGDAVVQAAYEVPDQLYIV